MMLANNRNTATRLNWKQFCICLGLFLTTCSPLWAAGPLTPEQSHAQFVLADPNLVIELVASEPDVQSPVAIAFDDQRRMYVVEMLDYPNGPAPRQPPEGRIRVLEPDKDGRYRARPQPFADKLLFANGILHYDGGFIVTCAPHILYLDDTNSDGEADKREILFEGFNEGNPQLRVSSPLLGLDGKVYVANGQSGGKIRQVHGLEGDAAKNAPVINISNRDFCFDPITMQGEAVSGMGQFGATFDQFGRRFTCTNRNHWIYNPLPEKYIRRNPHMVPPLQPEDDQGPGGAAKIYPLTRNGATMPEHAGTFSAACGIHAYCGTLLPKIYRESLLICDPTGNLVRQEVLTPQGAGFTGRPAYPNQEWLASRDPWFRPVFITTGPDRALYIVDFYHQVIEHPEWLPEDKKNDPSIHAGKDRGRIWRVRPRDGLRPEVTEHKEEQATQDADVLAAKEVRENYRLLQNGQYEPKLISRNKGFYHPQVRAQSIKFFASLISKELSVTRDLRSYAYDEDASVRFQAALALGAFNDNSVLEALAAIALSDANDPWTRLAVQTAVPERAGKLLAILFEEYSDVLTWGDRDDGTIPPLQLCQQISPERLLLVRELAGLVGSRRDKADILTVLEAMFAMQGPHALEYQLAVRAGLGDGVARRRGNWQTLVEAIQPEGAKYIERLDALMANTLRLAREGREETPQRLAAIATLSQVDWAVAQSVLTPLLTTDQPEKARLAAIQALSAHASDEVAGMLVSAWPALSPAARRATQEALLATPHRVLELVSALEAGKIEPSTIEPLRRAQLTGHKRSDVRERASKIFAAVATPERREVVARYQAALELAGDYGRGRAAFIRVGCASCHRVGEVGVAVGPDISDTRTKTRAALIQDILDPNAAIDGNYFNYVVETKDGRTLTGLLSTDTATSITLRRADGQTDTLLRQDLESVTSTGKSPMPENLETLLTPQDLADVVEYLFGRGGVE
ncbi:MAG: c-type cytochrome [Pirellulales bacterium]|nr:c-type cytochrome [Pirellulales bacterium]